MKTLLLLLALAGPVTAHVDVIPRPAVAQTLTGKATLGPEATVATGCFSNEAVLLAQYLHLPVSREGTIRFAQIIGLTAEAYRLQIEPAGVLIEASQPTGAARAIQTLRQLLPVDTLTGGVTRAIEVPCVRIEDQPRFMWRGIMLDASRHFQSKEFVKRYLDAMALHKLNVFHWHLTDGHGWRIAITNYPLLTQVGAFREQPPIGRYGGFYSQADIREVVAFAAARHIEIVPEIEMPGHSRAAIAAYPWLCCRKQPQAVDYFFDFPCRAQRFPSHPGTDVLCVGQEATFTFITNVLTETMALFPGRYIHVGGDEVNVGEWNACSVCQEKMKALGLKNGHQLQAWFMQRVEKFLAEHGRRLIGWDEILEGGLGPDATVMSWRGTQGGASAAKQGHDAVMSPGKPYYFDHGQSRSPLHPAHWPGIETLEEGYLYEPVPAELDADQARHILGVQANLWTCFTHTERLLELQTFPRLCALAENGWTPAVLKDLPDFQRRLEVHRARLDTLGLAQWREGSGSIAIGRWSPPFIATSTTTLAWSVPADAAGAMAVVFDYTNGAHKLDVHDVRAMRAGMILDRDRHEGFTGSRDERNTYRLQLPGGEGVTVEADVSSDGGTDSFGIVSLLPAPVGPKPLVRRPGLSTTTPVTQDRDRATYNWTNRHAQVLARNATFKPDVVVIGDSIMHYWSGEPAAPHHWGDNAWSNTFAGLKVTNLGFGWDRTENVLWRIEHGELDGIAPRWVVIKIGTNNTGINSPEEIAAGIEAVVAAVLEKRPESRVLLLGILPRRDEKPGQWAMSDRVNFLVATRMEGVERVTYRDVGNQLRGPDGAVDVSLFRDGVHVNDAGYARMGAVIRREVGAK